MADISGVIAGIGQGKTFWSVLQIANILENTDRTIITDIILIFEKATGRFWTWQEYADKYIKRPVRVNERIAVLSFEQACEFWRYTNAESYPLGYVEEQVKAGKVEVVTSEWKYGKSKLLKIPNVKNAIFKDVPDFTFRTGDVRGMKGIDYWIDEAHKKFPPMYYQRVGAQLDWYCSELRRLDDNLAIVTQHPEKVDKNVRRLATEWWIVSNKGTSPLLLGVTLPGNFRFYWYQQNDLPQKTDKATMSGWFRFDKKKRVHDLYDTMATSSMTGNTVLHSNKYKGRHWSVWVVVLLLIAFISWGLPRVLESIFAHAVHGMVGGVQDAAQGAFKARLPAVASNSIPPSAGPSSERTLTNSNYVNRSGVQRSYRESAVVPKWVAVVGYSDADGEKIYLNNGMVLKPDEWSNIGERYVRLKDGTLIPWQGRTWETAIQNPPQKQIQPYLPNFDLTKGRLPLVINNEQPP